MLVSSHVKKTKKNDEHLAYVFTCGWRIARWPLHTRRSAVDAYDPRQPDGRPYT